LLTNKFSFAALNTANAIGVIDNLTMYARLKKDERTTPKLERRVVMLELLQKITQRINIASLEISAVASELDCEEERASQVATYLKSKESAKEKNLIIGSMIVGAVGSIAAEIISMNSNSGNTSNIVAITTSIIDVGLGTLIILNNKSIEFYHNRNALKDIWNNPKTSSFFTPSIWYYLTYENVSKNEKSLRKQLIEKWQDFGQITSSKNKDKNIELYFGNGGKYETEQLKNRADMHDQIESYITLMKQDLKQLSIEIENLN
ncbi:MAG TPA: hypothetical protein PLY81_07840, partial [Chitinophagaceae bacterium]|nr:hypothetical protein [Chitinophagaceae bacterium]